MDIVSIRRQLHGLHGPRFWRHLDELADTPAFRAAVADEFPSQADALDDPTSRRRFLQVLGASLAVASFSSCARRPSGIVRPYVRMPEEIVPGRPLYYATAMALGDDALGLLVESHMGRPTKVEGNPLHPASLGATDHFAQALVLQLYDPDRSTVPLRRGQIAPWTEFLTTAQVLRQRLSAAGGAGLHVLVESAASPTLLALSDEVRQAFPRAGWHRYDLARGDEAHAGATLAFGRVVDCYYRFDRADVIAALDADFLTGEPVSVRYAHDFAERRRVRGGGAAMSRLYAIEGSPGATGAIADHRLPVGPLAVDAFARALGARLGVPGVTAPPMPATVAGTDVDAFLTALAADLQAHAGRSVVVPGAYQPASVHALAHAMNARLGNMGQTVLYIEPLSPPVQELESLTSLTTAMASGSVDVLLMLGGNPVYSAPADLRFGELLRQVPTSIHLSLFVDETSALSTWHVPQAHTLESWNDVRTFDGTATIVQPLIDPLYDGKTAAEVLASFTPAPGRHAYDLVRAHWRRTLPGPDVEFERTWALALDRGIVPDTSAPLVTPSLSAQMGSALPPLRPRNDGLQVAFRPDPSIYDGRFANNAWLQELPKPLTKLTWDNAVLMAPATGGRLSLTDGDVVVVQYEGRTVRGPVILLPGHAADAVTLHLGYGRRAAGTIGDVGFDANQIRTSSAPWNGDGLVLERTGETYALAHTQLHFAMQGRDFVRATTFESFVRRSGNGADASLEPHASLYPEWEYSGQQWGMVVDNTVCTGCNACIVACQAENNVPAVGKEGVLRQREMHWLRIDHYFAGEVDNPRSFFQPMLCQHCEKAPCEIVCPVAATVHSADGLNQMVYNRCVGTRYCSNNCPYKVRRFNFFDYQNAAETRPTLKMLMNPDVTVRTLGVMEKCTFCVQRINASRRDAENRGVALADGDVTPACEGACPTRAIVFGNINDPGSRVAQLKREPHNYALLGELQTQPRVTYLGAVRNLNRTLETSSELDDEYDR